MTPNKRKPTDERTLVLLIEHDKAMRERVEQLLQEGPYLVHSASDAQAALSLLSGVSPELIVIGGETPDMNACDLCRVLKQNPATQRVPVIVLLSSQDPEVRESMQDAGADDVLPRNLSDLDLTLRCQVLVSFHRTHRALEASRSELQRKNEELTRLERLREDLTQMLVHDLRNPLASLQGFIELAQKMASEERVRRVLQAARENTAQLFKLVGDLLDISRMEMGRLEPERSRMAVEDLIVPAADAIKLVASHERKRVEVTIEPQLPGLFVDISLMRRVLDNLFNNAMKHTPEGALIAVQASFDRSRRELLIAVSDTGEGIPEDQWEAIFDKFRQVEARNRGVKTGAGLGLAFCKMVVTLHGGNIWVQSAPGKGSTFTIALPASCYLAQARREEGY